jgi:hypothetical protein
MVCTYTTDCTIILSYIEPTELRQPAIRFGRSIRIHSFKEAFSEKPSFTTKPIDYDTMEESKLQALADSLAKNGNRKGLGTYSSGQYSWSKASEVEDAARADGLPDNALYNNFVKAGEYNANQKTPTNHGDGRAIKRDFSDLPVLVEDGSDGQPKTKKTKEEKKAAKKAAKLQAKIQAKLEEKRRIKKLAKAKAKAEKSSS